MAAVNARQFKHASLLLLLCVALQSVGPSVSQCESHAVPCPSVCDNQMPLCCFSANEEENVGIVVGNVDVVTQIHTILTDQTGSISLTQSDPYFDLVTETGAVRVKKKVDREADGDCVLLGIGIVVPGSSQLAVTVGVRIDDINDNAPIFASPSVLIEEDESDVTKNWVCINERSSLQATDDDIGSNGNISYSIGGDAENMFAIGADTCITNIVPIDRDSVPHPQTTEHYTLNLLVIATDDGNPPKNSSIHLIINVRDINDNYPQFTPDSLEPITVLENEMEGTVIHVLKADDRDYNSELTYYLDPATTLPFILNTTSGQLSVSGSSSLTYTEEGYTLSVGVTDSENSNETTLLVIVVNVNEKATFTLVGMPTRKIDEVSIYPSLIIYSIDDPDDAAEEDFSVELLGVRSDHFSVIISKNSFLFSIAINLDTHIDLEALVNEIGNTTFVLGILVTELGFPNISHTFEYIITVEGINDNYPLLVVTEFEFKEEQSAGSPIGQLEGIDLDSGINGTVVSYCIISATAQSEDRTKTKDLTDAFVTSNNNNPCLSPPHTLTAPKIDREDDADTVVIAMNLTDGGGNSNVSIITVNIVDVNDNFPSFLSTEYKFSFTEGQDPVNIGKVTADDDDTGANAEVEFELLNHRDLFTVNRTTGEVNTLTEFDREEKDMYSIRIEARNVAPIEGNMDDSNVNDIATITVIVGDINDSPPEWENDLKTYITITSNYVVGELVTVLIAKDGDLGDNAAITYTLDPAELFNVSRVGDINVAGSLENKIGTYSLTLTASNTAEPHHMAYLNITIEVERPDTTTDPSVAIYGSISGTILFVLLAIVVLFVILLFVYFNKRRQSVNLSNKNGRSHSNGVNSPTRGILRQIPSTSVGFSSRSNSTNGTGRGVKFDDKVQKIGYDDDHAVSNNDDVFFTESSIHLDSSGDESPQTPPRLHSVHHNGKLPSDGHSHSPNGAVRLSPIQENFLYSHQNYPMQEAYNLNLYDEDSEVQSDDDSTLPDNASSKNAPIPSVRHLQQYKSSPKHGMSRMPPSPHSSPPTSHLAPLPPMGQISPSHQFPLSPEHRTTHTTPPLHERLSSHSSSTDSLTPSPHPQHESSHMMRQTSRSTYPVHMPEGYVIPPSTHSAVPSRFPAESFMDPFEGTDYGDASTYASAELDEALNFRPDLEPGIYSLTATSSVYSYDNEESQL